MNLDRDNFYMKIVAFVQIYNFVVPTFFFIWRHLEVQKMIYYPYLSFRFLGKNTIWTKKLEILSRYTVSV
jgi:hypothetical protein